MIGRSLLVFGSLLPAVMARASIFDLYGMGARGLSMSSAMTATVDDFSATFYNPAALTDPSQVKYGGNFLLAVPTMTTSLTRPVCTEGSAACASRFGEGGYSSREPAYPDSFAGVTVGWVVPFESDYGRFGFGIALFVPTVNLIRAEALDPQTPQYYLYQNLPDQLVILASVAWAPVPWFSFGGGIQVLADVFGEADFAIDVTNDGFDSSDIHVDIVPKLAATAGLLFRPSKDLRLGVSYRQELGLTFTLPAKVDAGGVLVIGLDTGGSVLYSPHQIQVGAAYTIEAANLTVTAEMDYAFWSLAPDPSPRVAVTVGGDLLDAIGATGTLNVGDDAPPIDLGFHDTVTTRVALEWEPLDWFTARAGYAFRPTPAPRMTGPYNYLDNDAHLVSFGFGFEFQDPMSVHERPIVIDIGNSFGILPRRTLEKPPGDPVGDLEHAGWTYAFSLSITHSY